MVPTILGSVILAVYLYHIPETVGYDIEIKNDGFCKFQDVSRVKHTTLEVKSEQNIVLSFYNDNERLNLITIRFDGWKWGMLGGNSPVTTQLSAVEFTKYWFSWNGNVVKFGLGQVQGVNVLGTKIDVAETAQFKYVSVSITYPYNATLRFPDTSVFQVNSGTRLYVPNSKETTPTSLACGFICLTRPMCFAFNYRVGGISDDNCELHGVKTVKKQDIELTPFYTVSRSDWNYYFLL